ncbi:chromate transporter [Salisediminibacterium selenitireducens]|uniref:Chromate transporter n=1 Tax=Bacillus selenitireducens (strain ATCC 700615 / DSM 15326 / MLS10) TaxID=439292 RepID=D6XYG2_BACIE|nr:chromate transporter [Salisediminibacterium selenitireducens]ADI00231.1 Chromate transporter [[Bacillus] selenitireducens MLS10]
MTHKHLFFAFLRVGLLGYGGGPAAIPLVQKEVVENYKWMTDDEFSDMLAMGNTLPGPIATKLAGYVGYRVSGIPGMLNALAASVLPTVILMILLLATLSSFRDLGWVQGMTRGVIPVVAVLLGVLTWGFIEKSNKDLGWLKVTLLIVASVLLIQLAGVHPAIVIAALIIFVLTKPTGRKKEGEEA